ncbi:hypothetical protein PF008_g11961 [Phytophthora fragariae]|uniref:Tc1-like transposase DDE domain-containing protein n=1 Tax=Phytophthora fragariae TaxID=53985 RepID=A0A6G0RPD6_9STRA|nr:hypothetical protein PF008_g11961 [Phytophthora fragariae]
MAYTVKQTRIEPTTCNKLFNKTKRQIFARALNKHQQDGDCIVYFDESNFNVYCKRGRGRAKKELRVYRRHQPDVQGIAKAHIKQQLALDREAICDRTSMVDADGVVLTIKERTMRFLERAAHASMKYITSTEVTKMELHARDAVNAAEAMEDMVYGAYMMFRLLASCLFALVENILLFIKDYH